MNLLVQTQTHNQLDTQGLGLSSGLDLRLQTEYHARGYSIQRGFTAEGIDIPASQETIDGFCNVLDNKCVLRR